MGEPNYITIKGLKKLTDEIEFLLKKERPKIVAIVSWAASLGDRSENADYQYGKRRLREIDKRVGFLNSRVEKVKVVEQVSQVSGKVTFGVTVTVEDEDEKQKIYAIVGEDESNPKKHLISWKSPVGRALLGRSIGDEVPIQTPQGRVSLTIVDIAIQDLDIDQFVEP